LDDRVGLLLTGSPGVREVILELSATMNDFLATAAAVVRDRFGGRITYAAVPLERVDWAPFDIVSVDLYRSREIADRSPTASACPDLPWEPKAAFTAVAESYR
jgi:hypothetical protein